MNWSVYDYTAVSSQIINNSLFPSTVASNYWSSTTYAPLTAAAWSVNFNVGLVNGSDKTNSNSVRCVSGP